MSRASRRRNLGWQLEMNRRQVLGSEPSPRSRFASHSVRTSAQQGRRNREKSRLFRDNAPRGGELFRAQIGISSSGSVARPLRRPG